MKLIKTKPKYRCDFCRHSAGIVGMTTHEKICWKNPNRYCEFCKNKGTYVEIHGDLIEEGDGGLSETLPCGYCSKYKPL